MGWDKGYFQVEKLVVVDVDAEGKVEALVALVDYLEVVELAAGTTTSMKSVCFESRPTIMRWIYD